jgi:hypothetical protein
VGAHLPRDLLVAGEQEDFNPGQCKMPNGAKPSFGTGAVANTRVLAQARVGPQIDDLPPGCLLHQEAR